MAVEVRRARILEGIEARVRSWPMTRPGRAARLGITEAQLDDLLAGRFEGFTLEELARIGTLTGVVIVY